MVGIDPGATGAIVYLEGERLRVAQRLAELQAPDGSPLQLCPQKLAESLMPFLWANDPVAIERVGGAKKQSAHASFNFGSGWGQLVQEVGRSCDIIFVAPTAWKGHFCLIGKDKDASVALASQIFGAEHFQPVRLKRTEADCEGIAEAALIALYAERKRRG